jgi:phage tail tape-measure protein
MLCGVEEIATMEPDKKTNQTPEEPVISPAHTHGREVGALAGEIAGAVVGSIAGPAGTIAGLVLGAAAGALAGEAIDEEAERASFHDHELDDDIGVTKGDLGGRRTPLPPPK